MPTGFDCGWRAPLTRVLALAGIVLSLMLLAAPAIQAAPELELPRDGRVAGTYTLDVEFDPETRTLAGTMTLNWQNATGLVQSSLPFRLYPNAPFYKEGSIDVTAVAVDGVPVVPTLRVGGTVLDIPLTHPIEPNGSVSVDMAFTTHIPTGSSMQISVLAGSSDAGWWLADWYPVLAGWERGAGWFLDPPTRLGNPTFADSATYALTFTSPAGYVLVGSGAVTAQEQSDGWQTTRIVTPPGRDLTLTLFPNSPDAPLVVSERQIAGVRVRVSLPAPFAVPELAETMLDITEETLPHYQAWFGSLPFTELDLSPVSLSGFGGIAWSGAIWLDLDAFAAAGKVDEGDREMLRLVLAHELAHQWFPITVGSNNNRHGFMSESLANLLAIRAIDAAGHQRSAERLFQSNIVAPYTRLLESGNDGIVNSPVTSETDLGRYGTLLYGKGALGFDALRLHMGDGLFFGALRDFSADHSFGVATPADLLAAFEHHSGMELGSLWRFWFEQDDATLRDIDPLT